MTGRLGQGGMGDVYRARDTRLNRDVAIKTLPEIFAASADRVARFEREAQLLAALSHPNIAGIHGLERVGGSTCLVLEFIEGQTVAERLSRGPFPVAEALGVARQIADALQAAHDRGIIHRDLKPANVMITVDGHVKVLDFGLGKAIEVEPATDASNSPTMTLGATQAGMLLGTAAYMSPEQAKGLTADKRSDVWAFGCVLFEMLTGARAFHGDDVTDTLASVLRAEPDWTLLPAEVPPGVRALLEGCLRKNRRTRIGDVSAALFAIDHHATLALGVAPVADPLRDEPLSTWRRVWPTALASLVTAVLLLTAWWSVRPEQVTEPAVRFIVPLGEGLSFTSASRLVLALSPDGRRFVFVANNQLHVRALSDFVTRPLAGTDSPGGPLSPVFSPDGREVAFWSASDRTIKRVSLNGGVPVTMSPATTAVFGMTWDESGLLVGLGSGGVIRVSGRGDPEQLVTMQAGEGASSPQLLPGGRHLLLTLGGEALTSQEIWDRASVVVHALDSGARTVLVDGASNGRYLPTGHLVYARGGTVFAAPFDAERLEVGPEVPVIEGVRRGLSGVAQFTVSTNGVLAYVPGPSSTSSIPAGLAVADRSGTVTPLSLPPGGYDYPRASPDGRSIAFQLAQSGVAGVWVYGLSGASAMRRLTLVGQNRHPVWSHDSSRIAFQSDREGDLGIFAQRADGTGPAVRLTTPEAGVAHVPESWSSDGRSLLFGATRDRETALWVLSVGDGRVERYGNVVSVGPTTAAFSPDGRWVAYSVNTPDRESFVFVQAFPATGEVHQISKQGENGHHPMWTPDGKALFYVPQIGRLVAVGVSTEPSFTFTDPVAVPRRFAVSNPVTQRPWDLGPDGRILSVYDSAQTIAPEIRVVLHWFDELRTRVPAR